MIFRGVLVGMLVGLVICATSGFIAGMQGARNPNAGSHPELYEELPDYQMAELMNVPEDEPQTYSSQSYSSTANAQYYYTSIDYEQYGNLDDADIGDPADYEEYDYELPEG
jgi:hypothetical protein